MVVMVLEKVPTSLRGELTRWLLEAKTGVFVGNVSAMVRDRLWEKCVQQRGDGGIIQIWSTNTEQRFAMRSWGDTQRQMVEFDGLWLVRKTKSKRVHKTKSRKADS
jgi:CRISPR-associated protein Cas2